MIANPRVALAQDKYLTFKCSLDFVNLILPAASAVKVFYPQALAATAHRSGLRATCGNATYFRGEFAAASLKHRLRENPYRVLTDFRGEFAAASLKRADASAPHRTKLHFRGEFAAASLKQT
jgi:hypothetical protein